MKSLDTGHLPKDSPWLPYLVVNDQLQIMTKMLPELDIEEAEVLVPYLPKGWLGVLEGYLSIAIPFMAGRLRNARNHLIVSPPFCPSVAC